jgi:rare lipoprotein A
MTSAKIVRCQKGELMREDWRLWHLTCSLDSLPPCTNVSARAVRRVFMSRTPVTLLIAILFVAVVAAAAAPARKAGRRQFTASAYSIEGKSADGSKSGKGTVAADPNVLRLGSKIRVSGAGAYSGDYTVVDSGGRVKGNVIDIFMSSVREARNFGMKKVEVEILEQSRPRKPRGE